MYLKETEFIWANLDPNQHVRHTTYSDYATHARICFFVENGFTIQDLNALGFGPVLLREQTIFWRELSANERVRISVELDRSTADYSYYTIVQHFYKANNKKAARVTIDGTWMDIKTRQLIPPPAEVISKILSKMDKTANYQLVTPKEFVFL